jgi:hypothetical protein
VNEEELKKVIALTQQKVKNISTTDKETLIEFETKWKYAGPQDSKNRSFCAEMLKLNKIYTREEIDNLNNDMKEYNTDVWKYKGGWYHNPEFDQNFPQCRHWFAQVIVRKK